MSSDSSFFSDSESDEKRSGTASDSDRDDRPDVQGLGLKVVDIPTGAGGDAKKDRYSSDSDQDFSDGGSRLTTPRSRGSPSPRQRRRTKRTTVTLKDGSVLDLTPPEELLPQCEKKARYYTSKKQTDKAITEWTRYTALCRLVYGMEHWKLAEGYVHLAHAYLTLRGLAAQAQAHSETARSIMLNGLHTSESEDSKSQLMGTLLLMYYVLGRALTLLKKYQEAEQNLVKAERVSQELSKLSGQRGSSRRAQLDIDIAIALAKMYAKQQKHALSSSFYEKAIRLTEEQYGTDCPDLIPIYQEMGKLEQSKKEHANQDKATEYFLQAHSIAVARYSGQSEEVAETAHVLALAYSESATAEAESAAEQYLNESIGIRQVLFGPHHAKTISSQDDLCRLLLRTDRTDEAIALLKTLLTSKRATFGDLSAEVGEAYKLYGSILMSQGQLEKALKFFKKSHNIESIIHGPGHKKTKATQQTIDMLLQSPMLAAKEGQTRAGQLKTRPRFNAMAGGTMATGGPKIAFE